MGNGRSGGGSKFAEGARALAATKITPLADKATIQALLQAYAKWLGQLSPEMQDVITGYTYGDFFYMNHALRANYPNNTSDPELAQRINLLQEALLSSKIPFDTTVFRGVETSISAADARKMIGQTMVEPGFASTSLDFHTGYEFTGFKEPGDNSVRTVYQFTLPKGLSGGYINTMSGNQSEQEMLLPKGSQFRISGVRTIQYRGPLGNEPPEKVVVIKAVYLGPH